MVISLERGADLHMAQLCVCVCVCVCVLVTFFVNHTWPGIPLIFLAVRWLLYSFVILRIPVYNLLCVKQSCRIWTFLCGSC